MVKLCLLNPSLRAVHIAGNRLCHRDTLETVEARRNQHTDVLSRPFTQQVCTKAKGNLRKD